MSENSTETSVAIPTGMNVVTAISDEEILEMYSNRHEGVPDDVLATLETLDDVRAYFRDYGMGVEDISEYGTGYPKAEKETLLGVPFVAVKWDFYIGQHSDTAIVWFVTKDGRRGYFNDGSAGIREQLQRITVARLRRHKAGQDAPHPYAGLVVPNGLTLSEYDRVERNADGTPKLDEKGKRIPIVNEKTGKVERGATYYFVE